VTHGTRIASPYKPRAQVTRKSRLQTQTATFLERAGFFPPFIHKNPLSRRESGASPRKRRRLGTPACDSTQNRLNFRQRAKKSKLGGFSRHGGDRCERETEARGRERRPPSPSGAASRMSGAETTPKKKRKRPETRFEDFSKPALEAWWRGPPAEEAKRVDDVE